MNAHSASGSQGYAMAASPLAQHEPPLSIVILTLNEQANIADCIRSCAPCTDIHVLDSGSQDRTREIAESLGARVWVHPFESFGAQRNWAIDNIDTRHDWIFHLDADERLTPELIAELRRVLARDPPDAGFLVPHKLMFMGRWLRRTATYPTYQVRLFHKNRMRFTDYGHGQREDTHGHIGRLEVPYLHYAFSKGLFDWFDKHNRYSSLEAIQFIRQEERLPPLSDLLAHDPIQRRRAWKRVLYGVPGWPVMHMLIRLFVFGGILEGKAGISYATLLAMYEQMIRLKLRLLRRAHRLGTTFESDSAPRPASTSLNDIQTDAAETSPDTTEHTATAPETPLPLHAEIIPEPSPWTFREKAGRALWMLFGSVAFRLTFHNWYAPRRAILRLFGAKVARGVRIRPTARFEVPWNVDLREGVVIGDAAIIYSLGTITIGERSIISQYAHLCAGTHDHTDPSFPLIRDPITIGREVWIGADAFVGPNVRVGDRAVLGARSSAYKDLEPDTVYVGNPAKPIRKRELKHA